MPVLKHLCVYDIPFYHGSWIKFSKFSIFIISAKSIYELHVIIWDIKHQL